MRRVMLLVVAAVIILTSFSAYAAGVPQMINYQGVLLNGDGIPVSGTRSIEFLIYDVESAGTAAWSETQSVTTVDGLFSVLLGSVTPIPASIFMTPEAYLALRVGSDSEMAPRIRLVSAGYAFQAGNADSLGGRPAEAFVEAGSTNSVDVDMITPDIISSIDGVSNDGGNVDLVAGSNVTITPDDAANTITISASGGTGGDNLGNHTATQNIKLSGHWLSNDGSSNGVFVTAAGDVGIGDGTPSTKLDVAGSVRVASALRVPNSYIICGSPSGYSAGDIAAENDLHATNGFIRAGAPSSSYSAGDIAATDDLVADDDVIAGDDITAGDRVTAGGDLISTGNTRVYGFLGVHAGGGINELWPLYVHGSGYITEDVNVGNTLWTGGHVGINGSGAHVTYALRVAGSAYATGSWIASDLKFKKDIVTLKEPSRKLMDLRGVRYHWRKEDFPEQEFDDRLQYGLIAQEVEAVFPELVKTDDNGDKAVNYDGLIPFLLEAIKEQQQRIEQLEAKVNQ